MQQACATALQQKAYYELQRVQHSVWFCQMVPGESVLHVPEDCSTQVDIVLHEPHSSISGPALLVVVPHNVLVVGIRVLCEVALNQILGLLSCEAEHDVHLQCILSLQHINQFSAHDQQNELSADKAASVTQELSMHAAECHMQATSFQTCRPLHHALFRGTGPRADFAPHVQGS